MKKHLLLLALTSCLALSGCSLLDEYMNGNTPSEQDEEKPKDPIPGEDETPGEDTPSEEDQPTLVSIEIVGKLKKTEYFVGENWDTDGLSIAGTYSDGNVAPLPENEYEFGFTPYTPKVGTTEVTISARQTYGDLVADFRYYAVTVSDKPIQSIKIEGDFVQKTYIEDDPWNPEGLTVKAIIDEDNEFTLDKDKYTLAYKPEYASLDTKSVDVIAMLEEPEIDSPIKTINDIIVTPKPIEYTISFNGNGATSGSMGSVKTTETSYQAPACGFEKEGYSFEKWALNNVDGEKYSVGDPISISSNITLYALWKENPKPTQYTISFNGNGATSGTMSSVYTTETSYTAPSCGYQKEGYSFDKWALNSVDGTKYSVGSNISISSDITLYATWIEDSPIDDPYYKGCEGLSGSSLEAKLKSINAPKKPSYDWSRYEDADEALDDSTCILSIYTRHNIKKNSHCGDYSWNTWNREHVWTQSAYPASASDNHNIFACEGKINGERSNKPFAEGGSVVTVHGHTTDCKQTNSTFEPCDEAKGEIARSVMYGTVQYSYTMTNEIDSIYLALKWHLEHPITERETRRNEVVYGNQGNRNPFVDHPEYACRIWGGTNSQTQALCAAHQ